ncbi:MAG: DUF1259 domain-containing protein, partial [Verrucomicrobiota bacterium]
MHFRRIVPLALVAVLALAAAYAATPGAPPAASPDGAQIESLTGLKGTLNAGVFKVTSPRNEVPIKVDGWPLSPFMGLTSWAAFETDKKAGTMVMGDFVVFQDEVAPAMKAALTHGLEVTALHNHFVYDEPHVLFMHVGGAGEAAKLAGGVRALLDAVKAVRAAAQTPATSSGTPP